MKATGEIKTCSTCRGEFPLTNFHKNRHRPDGLHSDCKTCVSDAGKRWRRANPEKKRAQNADRNSERDYRRYTLKQYGLTEPEYDQMLADQGGACRICKTIPEKRLCVDHCHTTGRVRGLLCGPCNKALGLFRDNKDFLAVAIDYLSE